MGDSRGVSYSSIYGQYSSDEGAWWGDLEYVAIDATSRKATRLTPGKEYQVRLRGVFADGSYTAWSVITYASPLELDGSDGEQSWELRLPSSLSVVNPSFQTSAGWATSRFATAFSDVAPQVGQKLFVDGAVVFDDVLTTANANGQRFALTLGGGANVRFPSATVHLFELQTGAASTFTFSNVRPNEARFGDWSRLAGTFSALPKYDVGSQVYIQAAQLYSFAQPEAIYGVLTVYAQKSPALQLDGAYRCDEFRIYAGATASDVCAITAPGTSVRARVVNWGSASSTVAERLVSEPITLILQDAASLNLPDGAPESWVDAFAVDLSEATSAALTLTGQTVYGDAPTAEITLNGAAKVVERGLDVASLTLNDGATLTVETATLNAETLTLAADTTLTVDGGNVNVAELSVADGATVDFSGTDAILTATETATVGVATFSGAGYFATPQGTDLTAATFAEAIRVVDYFAGVADFTATATGPATAKLEWSATDATARVCIERENAAAPNGWEVVAVATAAESPLSVALNGRKRFRIFDGQTFYVDSAWFSVEFYQCRTVSVAVASTSGGAGVVWETNEGGIMFVDGKEPKVGENCCVYAKIKSPLSGTWVPAERIASVEATVWRTGSVVETTLGAVAYRPIPARTVVPGWNGVSLSPSLVLEAPILPVEPPVVDETEGYNFIWTPDVGESPIFPEAGTYRIQVVFTLDDGTQIYLTEDATVKNR